MIFDRDLCQKLPLEVLKELWRSFCDLVYSRINRLSPNNSVLFNGMNDVFFLGIVHLYKNRFNMSLEETTDVFRWIYHALLEEVRLETATEIQAKGFIRVYLDSHEELYGYEMDNVAFGLEDIKITVM